MKSLILATSLAALKVVAFPKLDLLVWMGVAIVIDFITGVIKAYYKNEARTSSGYRKTVVKFIQYGGSICVGIVLNNIASYKQMEETAKVLETFTDGLVVFIIYIEITSILENIYECDKDSALSRYFIKYALNFLTFQLKNNPATKLKVNDTVDTN